MSENIGHSGTIIHMRNVPGDDKMRVLDAALPCKNFDGTDGEVPPDFGWDGSSVPLIFQGVFPRHNHPIASCRHDWRCRNAKNAEERKWATFHFPPPGGPQRIIKITGAGHKKKVQLFDIGHLHLHPSLRLRAAANILSPTKVPTAALMMLFSGRPS